MSRPALPLSLALLLTAMLHAQASDEIVALKAALASDRPRAVATAAFDSELDWRSTQREAALAGNN